MEVYLFFNTWLYFCCYVTIKIYRHDITFQTMSKIKIWCCTKIILCWNKKIDVAQKVICFRQKRALILHEKVFDVNKKTWCSTKKYFMSTKARWCCIKKIFCAKKNYFFPKRCTIKLPLNETVDIIFKKSLEKYYKTIVFLFKWRTF